MPPIVQDMPPEGGYQRIKFERVPARSYFSGYGMIAAYLGITVIGWYGYFLSSQKVKRERIEARSAKLALYPLLIAERDRAFLKHIVVNREEEEKLMANVEGWETGTLYGESIYKTVPEDTFINPMFDEYYAHNSYKDWSERAHFKFWV